MSLKKTACLIFPVRHCMHHFNLQNGNGFEDNVSSYRLVLGQRTYPGISQSEFNFGFNFHFRN